MKVILCYGDSNLRGTIPGPALDRAGLIKPRYSKDKRWTGILQKRLGNGYNVIEEGIGGRTTSLDDTIRGRSHRNGLKDLPFCLETHYPIDLVIFLLGTNDMQRDYDQSVQQIGEGMRLLVRTVQSSNKGPEMRAPKVLIISPQPVASIPNLDAQFSGSAIEKSRAIAAVYFRISQEEKCEFLDAAPLVTADKTDGIHLDERSCQILGEAVLKKVEEILI
jgi:lysophospholipase L1-like esterase